MKNVEGWKSKYGAILLGIGTALFVMGNLPQLKEVSPAIATWFYIIGIGIDAFGGPLFGIGIAHKIQKLGKPEGQGGGATASFMTLIAVASGIILLLSGCAFQGGGVAPEDRVTVCNTVEGCQDSWICSVLAERGFVPEDVDGLLLDGNTIAVLAVGAYKSQKEIIAKFVLAIRNSVANKTIPWKELIDSLYKNAMLSEDYELILGIIQRRFKLDLLKGGGLMIDCDRRMVVYHLDRQLEILGTKPPASGWDDIILI
jgi:hypothetical protein